MVAYPKDEGHTRVWDERAGLVIGLCHAAKSCRGTWYALPSAGCLIAVPPPSQAETSVTAFRAFVIGILVGVMLGATACGGLMYWIRP